MKEPTHKYSQVGTIQRMGYPQRNPMESLRVICKDGFSNVIKLKGYGGKNKEAKKLLEQNHLKVCYDAQPHLLGGKLNPNDLDEEGCRKAGTTLIEAVDEAEYLGVEGIVFLADGWQPKAKDQAYAQLLKTARAVCDCVAARGVMVELEVFDYDMGKTALIGPTPHAAEFVAGVHITHNNFGLLVDLNHFLTTYETSRFVIRTLRPYITHFHFGDTVVVKDCDGHGGLHSGFGYPNSINNTPQLLDHLKVMKEEGLFDIGNPYISSMEVTLRSGEDKNIVLANTKRMLNRAWILPEDSV